MTTFNENWRAFGIRCGELARSRKSDWLSLVKILIRWALDLLL